MGTRKLVAWVSRTLARSSDIPELTPALMRAKRFVKVPPVSPDMERAIRLIAPQYRNVRRADLREAWEADQNAACHAEYSVLEPILRRLPASPRVLELGPGLARSLIFFSKTLAWTSADLHAWEGEGETTKYTMLGPRFEDSFCGNFARLREVLAFNGVPEVTVHDAATTNLRALPGPFDLIFSFYSVGFHWGLEHFIDDVLALLDKKGVAAFIVPSNFDPGVLKGLPHTIVDMERVYAAKDAGRMLLLEAASARAP